MTRSPLSIRVAARLLSEDHHCLIGDLEWTWRTMREHESRIKADIWLWGTLFTLVPRLMLRDLIWQHTMLRNYLTIAFRQIRKFKAFSAINVLGLALSMSVCLLIMTVITDLRSDDGFHEHGDRTVRVTTDISGVWGRTRVATSTPMMGPELLRELDDVEAFVQMSRSRGQLQREDGRMAAFAGLYAQPAFFDIFSFDLLEGNPVTALASPFQVVLSEELAAQLFPDGNAVGQLLERENGMWEVTGIAAPAPGRTHIQFDALFSFVSLQSIYGEERADELSSWTLQTRFYNYLLLAPDASRSRVEDVANRLTAMHWQDANVETPEHHLQEITAVNLGWDLSNEISSIVPRTFAIVLSLFASLLLITATFNYINLTVSRSLKRKAEIGVRKVVGAHRRQLIQQFVTEAVVTCFLALLLAWGLLQWMIPQFNGLAEFAEDGMSIAISAIDPALLAQFVGFALILGLAAGLVPALRVSRQSPVAAIRGSAVTSGRVRFLGRKTLVVFQFAISMIAITTITVLYHQSAFLLASDAGFDEDQLLHVELNGLDHERLSSEIARLPGIRRVAAISHAPATGNRTMVDVRRPDMDDAQLIARFSVNNAAFEQYGIELVAGRLFNEEVASDQTDVVILTEKALPFLGLGSPQEAVGTMLVYDTSGEENRIEVIGVVTDFYADGYSAGYVPVSLVHRPASFGLLAVRLTEGDPRPALRGLDEVWAEHGQGLPLNYAFLDDEIASNLAYMRDTMRILGSFAVLIVVIACLGLLGMAMFSTETRLKEVGIRKTLGADSWALVRLLSGAYVRLVIIAIIVAAPAAWILNSELLATFANRIDLTAGVMATGVLPVVLLALLTIGSQTLKAASTNPVEVMRAE